MEKRSALDREYQRTILEGLREHFPGSWEPLMSGDEERSRWNFNVAYLEGHGLISCRQTSMLSGEPIVHGAKITSQGIDFLEDDGGLSAVLGVVTVKLHDDTIKNLIAARLQTSNLPPAEKERYLDQLRSLPADATKHLVTKALDWGLENAPGAAHWLGTLIDQLGRN